MRANDPKWIKERSFDQLSANLGCDCGSIEGVGGLWPHTTFPNGLHNFTSDPVHGRFDSLPDIGMSGRISRFPVRIFAQEESEGFYIIGRNELTTFVDNEIISGRINRAPVVLRPFDRGHDFTLAIPTEPR